MTFTDLFLAVRHWLTCSKWEAVIQAGEGEVYMRCLNCGLRSSGMATGGTYRSVLAGDPARHRINKAVPRPAMPPADPVTAEVFEVVEDRTPRLSGRIH